MSFPFRHALVGTLVALALVMASVPAGDALDAREHASQKARKGEQLIVGFTSGISSIAIAAAGGVVKAQSATLGIALVYAADPVAFVLLVRPNPAIAFIEKNGPVFAEGSSADASGWDTSGWDASGWDASGWDASSSDASGWDASSWDASSWDASGWDASGWDASSWDASSWDASGWDASGWDASSWESAALSAQGTSASGSAGKDPLFPKQWGIRAVRSAAAMDLAASAAPGNLCIVDSGVDHKHPDLAARMARDPKGRLLGHDFVNGDSDPMDDAGHGTHVAGIAAAASKNGAGIMGASNARIMAVKVLAANGVGTEADLAFGIDWCTQKGASVVSMSLGTPEHSPAVHRAVKLAENRGVVLVASIGNAGKCYDCVRFPAEYDEVIAVGALRPDGHPAPFSSVSHQVDLAAPGVVIVSTLPGNRYAAMNGTSQAVPFVSATAAMMLAVNAALEPADLRAILAATATDLGPDGRDPYTGAGALDAEAALARATGG